jgi:hypothetical protein
MNDHGHFSFQVIRGRGGRGRGGSSRSTTNVIQQQQQQRRPMLDTSRAR